MENTQPSGPIEVRIASSQDTAFVGEKIYFSIIIRNRGAESVWIPRNPDVLLTWIYPNGQRDNLLRDFTRERFFSEADAVLLHPGQQMTKSVVVRTYYFPKSGITEFRARVHVGRNTNPRLQPFWHGETESNSYGIMVRPARRSAQHSDYTPHARPAPARSS